MSRSRTPQVLRALAADTAETYGTSANADHEGGGIWLVQWTNGPTRDQMRARAAKAAPGVTVDLHRSYTPRAWTLAALGVCLDGEIDRFGATGSSLAAQARHRLAQTEAPERALPGQELVGALADRYLERAQDGVAVYEERLLGPLAAEGVAGLLTPRQANLDATDVLVMSPAQHLTAFYASGEDAWAWRMRLRTLPAPDLVAAAQADTDLDQVGRLAVLGLLEDMRRLWEETEAAAFAAARDTDAPGGAASWAQIGAVLGISRQGAHERGKRRTRGALSRLA